jgi:predicted nuclease of restriction endonuclease-like (RecB) superfamily
MYYWSVGKDIHWSRAVLLNFLDTDLYERQGYDENPAQNQQRILGCFALS